MKISSEVVRKLVWLETMRAQSRWLRPLYAIHNNGFHLYLSSNATENFFEDVRRITDWRRMAYRQYKFRYEKISTVRHYPFTHHGHIGEFHRGKKRPASFSIAIVGWQTFRIGIHETLYFFELERRAEVMRIIQPLEWSHLEGLRGITG